MKEAKGHKSRTKSWRLEMRNTRGIRRGVNTRTNILHPTGGAKDRRYQCEKPVKRSPDPVS
jgi:hypothetical protein